jgi:hypothetical protein
MLYSTLSLLQSNLDGGVIATYLVLISTMRAWFDVLECGVPDSDLSTGGRLLIRIQMRIIDRQSWTQVVDATMTDTIVLDMYP